MTLLPPPQLRSRPTFYVYAVVDKTSDPPALVTVKNSRAEARKEVEHSPDADTLRIRRGRLTLFET